MSRSQVRIPIDCFNAELRRLGRVLYVDTEMIQEWRGDEFGLRLTWADGFSAWIGFGPVGTAVVQSWDKVRH